MLGRVLTIFDHGCLPFSILQADQKGKVRSNMSSASSEEATPTSSSLDPGDDIIYFYRCQSMSLTGELKGCGFFKLLDCVKEGRGPLIGARKVNAEDG